MQKRRERIEKVGLKISWGWARPVGQCYGHHRFKWFSWKKWRFS
jgi:hypothetical protein